MKTLIASAASLLVALAGCGKKADDGGGAVANVAPGGGGGTAPSGDVTLDASGSTFQKAYQESAIEAFTRAHGNIKINYGGGGSGKGRTDLAEGVTDFAGSDAAFKDEEAAKAKGGAVLYFPILLGAISVTYNVDGIDKLQLSAATLAKVFQRDIKKWNDPAIAADNPGAKLPDAEIVVVHRADGSGTTDNFTKYLAGAAADAWKLASGSTVEWPADTQAGQGNAGVAQLVKSTRNSIGYVDQSDAKASGLKSAWIKNAAGTFIDPTAQSASAAAEGIELNDHLTFSALNGKAAGAYPITYQSWVIVYAKQADKTKGAAVKAYLAYLLGEGQQMLPELDFAALPHDLAAKAVAQLDKIQI
jgi:phosphate transport system substrate-binding protein